MKEKKMIISKEFLLEHSAEHNSVDRFLIAIIENDLRTVQQMVKEKYIDVNHVIDDKGTTFLHHAVQQGQPEMIHFLLNSGANPNVTDKRNNKPVDEISFLHPNHKKVINIFQKFDKNIKKSEASNEKL